MKIYLVRHGKTVGNEERRYTGQSNVSVSKNGIDELIGLKHIYKDIKNLSVYTSCLNRTEETARILFGNYNHIDSLSFMNETDFGDFEGLRYTDLKRDANYLMWINDIYNEIPKNGESYIAFKERVIPLFMNHINKLTEDSIYVTHGGVIRIIMSSLVDPNIAFFDWEIPNGKGYILHLVEGRITYEVIK